MRAPHLSPRDWMLWQWWLCLTAIYWALDYVNPGDSWVKGAVGLVAPLGLRSVVFGSLANRWWPWFLALDVAFAIVMDRLIRRAGYRGWRLMLSCLATLFVATFVLDLSWYFGDPRNCFWASWQIFRGHNSCGRW